MLPWSVWTERESAFPSDGFWTPILFCFIDCFCAFGLVPICWSNPNIVSKSKVVCYPHLGLGNRQVIAFTKNEGRSSISHWQIASDLLLRSKALLFLSSTRLRKKASVMLKTSKWDQSLLDHGKLLTKARRQTDQSILNSIFRLCSCWSNSLGPGDWELMPWSYSRYQTNGKMPAMKHETNRKSSRQRKRIALQERSSRTKGTQKPTLQKGKSASLSRPLCDSTPVCSEKEGSFS